jgi:hypothetical protein
MACPSVSQCTAVVAGNAEITFDPTAPGSPTPVTIDTSGQLDGVVCPSVSQCTAFDGQHREVTFDPTEPAATTPIPVVQATQPCTGLTGCYAQGVSTGSACPSVSQCTIVTDRDLEVTFAPVTGTIISSGTLTAANAVFGGPVEGLVCPSVSQCTTFGPDNNEVTFNPLVPADATQSQLAPQATQPSSGNSVAWWEFACASTTQCTVTGRWGATGGVADGEIATFDPQSPSCVTTARTSSAGVPSSVAPCPGTARVGRLAIRSARTSVPVQCNGMPWAACTVKLSLVATERITHERVIAATRAARKPAVRKTVTLGVKTATIPGGHRQTVVLSLNKTEKRLLARVHRMHARLTISQSSELVFSRSITLSAGL